jgi:hypothetical protein
MNEFLYNFAWWFYTVVTAFMFGMTWVSFVSLIKDDMNYISIKFKFTAFVVIFFITLTMLFACIQFLNWIGG